MRAFWPSAPLLTGSRRRRIVQITLKSMLVALAIVSIACGILFAVESTLAFWLLVAFAANFSALLLGSIVYDRGAARAFAIGALPLLVVFGWLFLMFDGDLVNGPMTASVGLGMLLVGSCGGTTMLVWRIVSADRMQSQAKQPGLLSELTVGIMVGLLIAGSIGIVTWTANSPQPQNAPIQTTGGII